MQYDGGQMLEVEEGRREQRHTTERARRILTARRLVFYLWPAPSGPLGLQSESIADCRRYRRSLPIYRLSVSGNIGIESINYQHSITDHALRITLI